MPSKTEVVLEPALVRKIGFGVLDSAWLGDNNFGGACFSLEGRDTSHVYFNKCIEPKTNLSDRGTQFFEVDRDSDEMLLFQIIPMQSSDWGWTYWTFTFENSKKAFD
jgi:hypothetical protein